MEQPENQAKETYALAAQCSELLFAILPFAVVFLIFAFQKKGWVSYVMAPEWAFASALLFGQTVVKIVQGTLKAGYSVAIPVVILVVSMLIVLGLVPSMVLLALILASPDAPLWMGISQLVLALIAAATFLLFGTITYSE